MLYSLIKKALILPIKIYQWTLSPLIGQNCRYHPTCSRYMIEAIEEWGPLKGLWLGIVRISRCHPWSDRDMHDPVPKKTR